MSTSTSPIRCYQDNVIIRLDPPVTETESGLAIVQRVNGNGHRVGEVLGVGPGHYSRSGKFIPIDDLAVGDRVVVAALAGQNYALDFNVPRHNKSSEFQELHGERGEYRIVRYDEILGVLDKD